MSEVFNNNEFTSEPSQQSSNSYPYSFEQPFDAQQQPFAAQPQPSAPVPEQKKKSGKAGKIVALLLACALVGGGSGFGAAALMQKNAAAQPQSTTQASSDASVMLEAKRQAAALQVASVDTGKVLTPSEVYAQNVNSTVGITTSITTNYFGYQTTSAAAGSGFILTQDGYILTNYHVIEGASTVKVTAYDGTTYDAAVIGGDEDYDDDYYEDDFEDDIDEAEERSLLAEEERRQRRSERKNSRRSSYEEDEPEPQPAPEPRRTSVRTASNKVVPIRTTARGLEVCICKPKNFGDSTDACEMLLQGRAVVVNLEGIDIMEAQRIMDFISGCIFAISGKMHQISRYIFIFSPESVDISGDYLELSRDDEFGIPTLNKEF